ncbi:hypothetical protein ACOZ4I_00775 [Haloarcula salina]
MSQAEGFGRQFSHSGGAARLDSTGTPVPHRGHVRRDRTYSVWD